ncbi:hypothetical protein PVAP13_5NG100500 [Panicum virgatum]|uniref:Uncharacterized protein n=1 Tax=Panicum virgatum TaxID=38727 RepID=A0A8T0RLZ2_PANVG|nr:hypothetical protein PVAP13_5NG100500 [Panicum virgatum]
MGTRQSGVRATVRAGDKRTLPGPPLPLPPLPTHPPIHRLVSRHSTKALPSLTPAALVSSTSSQQANTNRPFDLSGRFPFPNARTGTATAGADGRAPRGPADWHRPSRSRVGIDSACPVSTARARGPHLPPRCFSTPPARSLASERPAAQPEAQSSSIAQLAFRPAAAL